MKTEAELIKTRAAVDKILRDQIKRNKRIKAIKGLLGFAVFLLIIAAGIVSTAALVSAIMAPRAVVVLSIWVLPFIVALGSTPFILAVVYLYGKIDEKIRKAYEGRK